MNIVFFTHPDFQYHQSMPRFARMLSDGMRKRGHQVQVWAPAPLFSKLPLPASLKKWMGYIDQYILFPLAIKKRLKKSPADTLFVFCDQALGPWVPLLANRPHIIHCHDFLAQRSALGLVPENRLSWTGRQYQAFIRRGYSKGRNFISVSNKTKEDLHQFHKARPEISEVVYNGLTRVFSPGQPAEVRDILSGKTGIDLTGGYLLHVGGNQWYKNRGGVIELYNAWRSQSQLNLPLLMVGHPPSPELSKLRGLSPYQSDIYFLADKDDEFVRMAYAGASIFLYPSLAEGFGWPIAEAMASGCPVLTTAEPPMTEVAGNAGFLIPRRPDNTDEVLYWATKGATMIAHIINLDETERKKTIEAGLNNAKRFDPEIALNKIEHIYSIALNEIPGSI